MKSEKINNYKLTGSIHTLQIKSADIPEIPAELQECISSSTRKNHGKIEAISIINPNKLLGDCFSFTEFEDCLTSILEECGVGDYSLMRVDFRMDSYNSMCERAYISYRALDENLLEKADISKLHNDEIFVQHPNYVDYFVSQYGRVISRKYGRVTLLKPYIIGPKNNQYLGYSFSSGEVESISVHRAVAEVFCPNFWRSKNQKKLNLQAHHIDGNHYNNDYQNVDISEEIIDRSLDQISSCFLTFYMGNYWRRATLTSIFKLMVSMLLSCRRYLISTRRNTKTGRMIGTQSKEFVTNILEKMHLESLPRVYRKSGRMQRKSIP